MVGEKDSVRRRMVLNKTTERDSLRWRLEMSSATASLTRDTPNEKASPKKYREERRRATGKKQTFLS